MTAGFVPLRETAEFINGVAFRPDDWGDSGMPIIRIQNLTDSTKPYNHTRRVVPKRFHVESGDLLVSWSASLGVFEWLQSEIGLVNQHIFRVVPDEARVDKRYLRYVLESALLDMQRHLHGATMQHVNRGEFLDTRIYLPSLPEQRRIAAILDQADALCTKRRAAIAQLDTLAQSIFLDMFGDPARNRNGWPRMSVGELASRFSDGPFGSNLKSSHYTERGVRVIRLQNIGAGKFLDDDKAYISEEHFASLRKHECRAGDVLIGTLGDPNLRACIQPDWLPVALNKADCVQLRPKESVANAAYICALLNEPATARMAKDLILGETRLRISMGRLRGLQVPVPNMCLQRKFADEITALEVLRSAHQSSLVELDALFASLQHRAFRGEL